MKRIIVYLIALVIFLIAFTSCTPKGENRTEQENSGEQETNDSFMEETTPEATDTLSGQLNNSQEINDTDNTGLEELIKKGTENKNQYNGVYYKTEFVSKDGEILTSETWLNIETAESKIDYLFMDEDGTLTRIVLYKLLSGTHIYSPTDNFMMSLPMTAAQLGDDIPLVPLVPSEPMTVEDIDNGIELLEFKGYETSEDGEYLVLTHAIDGRVHTIWLDKKTGLLAKQTIASDEGIMEFYDYRYFDIEEGEFDLPDDVPTM